MSAAPALLRGAVVGWPARHSVSPALHARWIEKAGINAVYDALPVAPQDVRDTLRRLGSLGYAGVNVTIPHKETALEIADEASDRARGVGAANLLVVAPDGRLRADNTDVEGFRRTLEPQDAGAENIAVVIGAGGAARAIIAALAEVGVGEIRIVNRTRDKAEALAALPARFRAGAAPACVFGSDESAAALAGARLLVNTTPLGMEGQPPLALSLDGLVDDALVYDVIYAPLETALLAEARRRGCRTHNGLAMLVGQAMPSFEAIFKTPVPVDAPYDAEAERYLAALLAERSA